MPRKADYKTKNHSGFFLKDHREKNERFKQIFFLSRPPSLEGFPSADTAKETRAEKALCWAEALLPLQRCGASFSSLIQRLSVLP